MKTTFDFWDIFATFAATSSVPGVPYGAIGIWLKKMSASGLIPFGGTIPAKTNALQCGGWQWTHADQPAVFIIAMWTFTSEVRGR